MQTRLLVIALSIAIASIVARPQAVRQQMPSGIERTALIDNASVVVARLKYAPGARETSHTHPFSAVVIQLTPGQISMIVGDDRSSTLRPPGYTRFVPRDSPHAYASADTCRFEILSVAIK